MDRRKFLFSLSLLPLASRAEVMNRSMSVFINKTTERKKVVQMSKHTLPDLPYAFNALEPYIDAQTMEIHHDKHHGTYVTKLNDAIAGTDMEKMSLDELLKFVTNHPASVRNNGGGHYNHSMFWQIMKPNGGGKPEGSLLNSIESNFGSFEDFKKKFSEAALNRFGSGWAWLVVQQDKKLAIGSTANQDNPIMDISDVKGTPIFGLDVWEHAYYLKYQNKRAEYIDNFWNVVNWQEVQNRFQKVM